MRIEIKCKSTTTCASNPIAASIMAAFVPTGGAVRGLQFSRPLCKRRRNQSIGIVHMSEGRATGSGRAPFEAEYAAELAEAERKYGPRGRRKAEIREESERALEEYNVLRSRLAWDTAFIAALGVCAGWGFGSATTALSAAVGGASAMVYIFLLSRGVDRIADSARAGADAGSGGDGQAARIAVLVLLIALIGRSGGRLELLPAIINFFSYKIAMLLPLISGEAFED